MAGKQVQVKRFTNIDQLEIGQKARFIGDDGREYETSPVQHFNIQPDGRVSVSTKSGNLYANYDIEAQRIKDNAEWEAKLSPEQKARSEERQRLYQLQAQNKMNQMQQNTFNEDFAQYVVDRLQEKSMVVGNLTAFDPNTMMVWKDNQWQQPVTMQDFQSGACLYFGNVEFEHLLDPQLHESQPNFQIQIRACGTTADGYFWMDTDTHILSNAPREGLERALQEKFHEFEQTQSQEAQDPTDMFN